MRGRKPTPRAQKILQGNPGGRPLNDREPCPEVKAPRCPAFLSAAAKVEWRRVSRELLANRVLTELDRAVLAMYCQVWARWVEAEKQLAEKGPVVTGPNGGQLQNAYLAVANRCVDQMARLMAELGLTPASRPRIKAAPPPAEEDPFNILMRRMQERSTEN